MDLILWRHAEAEPGEPDVGRRLTAKGLKQAERVGEEGLSACLADTRDAWELRADGSWAKLAPRGRAHARSAQQTLLAAMREPDEVD